MNRCINSTYGDCRIAFQIADEAVIYTKTHLIFDDPQSFCKWILMHLRPKWEKTDKCPLKMLKVKSKSGSWWFLIWTMTFLSNGNNAIDVEWWLLLIRLSLKLTILNNKLKMSIRYVARVRVRNNDFVYFHQITFHQNNYLLIEFRIKYDRKTIDYYEPSAEWSCPLLFYNLWNNNSSSN